MPIKLMTALAAIWRRLANLLQPDPTKLPKKISDHLARDIGMSRADLERHRFTLPSQSGDRPLL